MQSIETVYKGYRLRSRAEARWMILLDALNIRYYYEPEGFLFDDGIRYLPDFYLPDQDAFLEIKGLMSEKDEQKIKNLCVSSRKNVFVGEPGMNFYVYFPGLDVRYTARGTEIVNPDNLIAHRGWDCAIHKCRKCGKVYFKELSGAWDCECCGYYDGDSGFRTLMYDNGHPACEEIAEKAVASAKGARFEHMERQTM